MSTPLERLDDAIHEYLAATSGVDRSLSGWVLGLSTSRVVVPESPDDLPRVTGANYAIGPQTSTTDAAGIVRFLDVALERSAWAMLSAGEAEDEDDED